jgi:hypothetical protein
MQTVPRPSGWALRRGRGGTLAAMASRVPPIGPTLRAPAAASGSWG